MLLAPHVRIPQGTTLCRHPVRKASPLTGLLLPPTHNGHCHPSDAHGRSPVRGDALPPYRTKSTAPTRLLQSLSGQLLCPVRHRAGRVVPSPPSMRRRSFVARESRGLARRCFPFAGPWFLLGRGGQTSARQCGRLARRCWALARAPQRFTVQSRPLARQSSRSAHRPRFSRTPRTTSSVPRRSWGGESGISATPTRSRPSNRGIRSGRV
jgi:hypothetical protein